MRTGGTERLRAGQQNFVIHLVGICFMCYDELKPKVKERDGKCTEPGCTSKAPVKYLAVVRIDPYEVDTMENLRTVCKKHKPDWES